MQLSSVWKGDESEDSAILILVPLAEPSCWIHPSAEFSWTQDGLHGHHSSSPIFILEHYGSSWSEVCLSSDFLLQQLIKVKNEHPKWDKRPWLLLGHGTGGIIIKCLFGKPAFRELYTDVTIGIVLLDVPNVLAFDTSEQLSNASEITLCSNTSDGAATQTSFQQLCEAEKQFSTEARELVIFNCFTLFSRLERKQVLLNLPHEVQYCFQTDSSSLCQYDSKDDLHFLELCHLIRRAATLTKKQIAKSPVKSQRRGLDSRSAKLLVKFFPLDRRFSINLHTVKFFSYKNTTAIKTHITSHQTPVEDFCCSPNGFTTSSGTPDHDQTVCFSWHHAAANHSVWIKHMMDRLLSSASGMMSRTAFANFWSQNEQLSDNRYLGAWDIKPTCTFLGDGVNRSGEATTGPMGIVLVMPFLHWDTIGHLSERQAAIDVFSSHTMPYTLRKAYENAASNPETRFTSASILPGSPLYLPLPLDQYRYPTISLPVSRLKTQILPRQTQKAEAGPKTLVVHQLWLVIANEYTIVTFFPRKEPENDSIELAQVADLESAILNDTSSIEHPSDVCSNIYDFCALILHCTTTVMLSQSKHPDLLFMHFYRNAVGELRQKHLSALASFRDQDLRKTGDDMQEDANQENYELSLVLDTAALADELRGLSTIIDTQLGVIEKLGQAIGAGNEDQREISTGGMIMKRTCNTLRTFHAEFEGLRVDTKAIESDLLHLLDLRQKRANLREAHAACMQAKETAIQTKHSLLLTKSAAWQSQIITIFTLLSAIYLPLSFICSYYGMNLQDITGDNGNLYTVDQFWSIAAPTSAGITILATLVGFRAYVWSTLRGLVMGTGIFTSRKGTNKERNGGSESSVEPV